jgi:glycosyltransferase involved in cell wall biosynthesis
LNQRIVFCSKSPWLPSIRREHAFAQQAASHGVDVTFVERPDDIRQAKTDPLAWLRGFRSRVASSGGVTTVPRSTLVPGHRSSLAETLENRLLASFVRPLLDEQSTVVGLLPWQWPAISRLPGRKVFDCTDNWAALMPHCADRIGELFRRIGDEADEVLVTSGLLGELFGGRDVTVVRNGVSSTDVVDVPAPVPGRKRMVYAGTLSERFDVDLVAGVLNQLSDWHLELYGECRYAGSGSQPSPELQALLADGRVRWNGVVERTQLPEVLDAADVLILPNDSRRAEGQSSMKLYDYAARGRPIVSTPSEVSADQTPPGTAFARGPEEFAAAVAAAETEDRQTAQAKIDWVRANTWEARWPVWSAAVLGGVGRA